MKTKRIIFVSILTLILFAAAVFVRSAKTFRNASSKLTVSASIYPLAYFIQSIGEPHVDVHTIVPAGSEPHDYDLTPSDIKHVENSKLLVLNGGTIEPWSGKMKTNLKNSSIRIVDLQNELNTNQDINSLFLNDPHFWLNPSTAMKGVHIIQNELIKIDPSNKKTYTINATFLTQKLMELDAKMGSGLSQCARTEFISAHNAFGQLAYRYRLNQIPISGVSPDELPSPSKLAEIVKIARQKKIKYIFFENLVSPKLSETIAKEVGAQTLSLHPLEGLTSDEIKAGKTYFTIMEENLQNLQLALSCQK